MFKTVSFALLMLIVPCGLTSSLFSASVFPGEEWQTASPEEQGIDPNRLNRAIQYLKDHSGKDGVAELVIILNGYLVWQGPRVDRKHGVWSLTKSFTSTVLGLLIEEGKCSLDTLAKDIVPEMAETYPTVTLRHFTTMTSGYRAEGDETTGGYTHGPSATPFVPSPVPLFSPPGSKYAYWDSAMNQFAHVLTRIAGKPLKDYLNEKIARPIGMNPDQWDWGFFRLEDGSVIHGGAGNHGKHVMITARELARFGLLYLNRGRWNDAQLIPESWIDQACSVQVAAEIPVADPQLSPTEGSGAYGYNWWINGTQSNGERKWPDAPAKTFSASGYNNNDLFIIPEWNMVIVRLGLDQNDHAITDHEYSTFLNYIGDALTTGRTGP